MQGKRKDLLVISKVVPKIWARTNSAMATGKGQQKDEGKWAVRGRVVTIRGWLEDTSSIEVGVRINWRKIVCDCSDCDCDCECECECECEWNRKLDLDPGDVSRYGLTVDRLTISRQLEPTIWELRT